MKKKLLMVLMSVIMMFTMLGATSCAMIGGTGGDDGKYTLVLENENPEGGTVSGAGDYEKGTNVLLTATPNSGYVFSGWFDAEGEYINSEQSYAFDLNADTTVKAKFVTIFSYVKSYLFINGTFDSESSQFTCRLGVQYGETSKYTREAVYNLEDNEIVLYLFIDADTLLGIYAEDEFDGVYLWVLSDIDGHTMGGTMYASTFTSNSVLNYIYDNLATGLEESYQELATAMAKYLLSRLDGDLAVMGLEAEDLGFLYW